jgi:hypothetical protein
MRLLRTRRHAPSYRALLGALLASALWCGTALAGGPFYPGTGTTAGTAAAGNDPRLLSAAQALSITGLLKSNGTAFSPVVQSDITGLLAGGIVPGSLTIGAGGSIAPLNITSYGAPPASGGVLAPVLNVNINAFGTPGTGIANLTNISIVGDAVNASNASGGGLHGLYLGHNISSGAVGGRTSLSVFMNQTGATTLLASQFYVAFSSFAQAAYNTGGTSGASRGNLFAQNPSALLMTGATYWNSLIGMELDVGAQTGTNAIYKGGFKVVQWATDAVQGTSSDYAYGMANQAPATQSGWGTGFAFGLPEGYWPLKPNATMMGTLPTTFGGAYTAAIGIDFSAVTFGIAFLKSAGFVVDATGGITATLPTADPHALGKFWDNSGVVTRSHG